MILFFPFECACDAMRCDDDYLSTPARYALNTLWVILWSAWRGEARTEEEKQQEQRVDEHVRYNRKFKWEYSEAEISTKLRQIQHMWALFSYKHSSTNIFIKLTKTMKMHTCDFIFSFNIYSVIERMRCAKNNENVKNFCIIRVWGRETF